MNLYTCPNCLVRKSFKDLGEIRPFFFLCKECSNPYVFIPFSTKPFLYYSLFILLSATIRDFIREELLVSIQTFGFIFMFVFSLKPVSGTLRRLVKNLLWYFLLLGFCASFVVVPIEIGLFRILGMIPIELILLAYCLPVLLIGLVKYVNRKKIQKYNEFQINRVFKSHDVNTRLELYKNFHKANSTSKYDFQKYYFSQRKLSTHLKFFVLIQLIIGIVTIDLSSKCSGAYIPLCITMILHGLFIYFTVNKSNKVYFMDELSRSECLGVNSLF